MAEGGQRLALGGWLMKSLQNRVYPIGAVLGLSCWTLAQARLLESRHPAVPLILYIVGLVLVIPALMIFQDVLEDRRGELLGRPYSAAQNRWLTWDVLTVLLAAALLAAQASTNLVNVVRAALLVPTVYVLARVRDTRLTGVLAAGFIAMSVWPLTLVKSDPLFLALAVVSGIGLTLLYFGIRQKVIGYVIGAALLIAVLLVAAVGDFAETSWTQAAADGLSPVLTLLDSLSASLLLFNLTGDPNSLHGLANRPVFAPPLSALFVFGLLAWVMRFRQAGRWLDVFPFIALVVMLLPSALSVYYPDAQRAALALPVAMFFAAYGASVVARLLVRGLGNLGAALALWLILAVLVVTAADAMQHFSMAVLPPSSLEVIPVSLSRGYM